jgi:polysaccharide export outer membrane protein
LLFESSAIALASTEAKSMQKKQIMPFFIAAILPVLFMFTPSHAQDTQSALPSYKVLPGDVLLISVWKEEDLQLEALVRPDSAFSFPLAGEISTRNRSVLELQEEVTRRLSRYIADPVVTVSVQEVLGNKIYVIGQVNKPGVFVVNPQVDVIQALSMAGGTTPFAALNDIKILRRTGSQQRAISFRYNDVVKGNNLEQNIVLQSGDVVLVP